MRFLDGDNFEHEVGLQFGTVDLRLPLLTFGFAYTW